MATDRAMPRLKAAVVRAFMIVISLVGNHCINKGPEVVSTNANPRPMTERSRTRVRKFGANPERDNNAIDAHPMMNDRRIPTRAISMPLGSPKAAATRRGKATNRPAAARLIWYSSMTSGKMGDTVKMLSPTLKCPAKSRAAITNRYLLKFKLLVAGSVSGSSDIL